MFSRVPYTEIGGRHRPYLEVLFHNQTNSKKSNKTFAMVDSGADHTVIPYSIGSFIGLSEPTEQERLASASGVGGNQSYIERKCRIYVANRKKNKVYAFDETVWWIYPDAETKKRQSELINTYQSLNELKGQCIAGTGLHGHFENQMKQTIDSLIQIGNKLEVGVLLGRPFFDNFEYIQFFHKDRNNEGKCFFNYKVAEGKAIEIIPLEETILSTLAITTIEKR